MEDELLKAWLRQANADLQAGCDERSVECHRRYWLQQACEKGIKALGMMHWSGPAADEGLLRAHFLHNHSPLRQLEAVPAGTLNVNQARSVTRVRATAVAVGVRRTAGWPCAGTASFKG